MDDVIIAERSTTIVDEEVIIIHALRNVKVDGHARTYWSY